MYKLLLADDEKEIRNGLSQYFPWAETGYELVGLCENGQEALRFMDSRPVDVLLCDIRMPVMNGLEVAKRLHETKSKTKVVFLSGYKDFEYAKQALSYDVHDYIVKPTQFGELSRVFTSLKLELDESSSAGAPASGASFDEKVIAAIKSYVEENYPNATLEEAAARVHMNPHYVSKYFKDKTGDTFSDYLVGVKMAKAAELLMDIRYKTYEISEMVGYGYAKNFTRTFRKHFGLSPREFRSSRTDAAPPCAENFS
ncbi:MULTISPECIES: response regulator transcription factor [Cohnella]|uniref:response regulator transcription factor n=1 Tax=Cohnella TaxID=329857 RepID=UPI0009BB3F00|nr:MULTISPECIES: response regulator [Cohnella]MBN2981124.1 response regulator [Cohnella algarum]